MWTRAALLAERLWRACNGVYCRHAPLSGLGANPDGAKAVPHVARSASSSFIAAASLFAAAVLGTGCGGGSTGHSDITAEAAGLRDTSNLVSPSEAAPPAIAPAYSWKYIQAPDGSLARTIGGAGSPNLINTAGELIASYGNNPPGPYAMFHDLRSGTTKSIFDPSEHRSSFADAINERGDVLVVRWGFDIQIRPFLWSSQTGQLLEIATPQDVYTETRYLSNDGVVGGTTDGILGPRDIPVCFFDTTQCVAFHWDPDTGTMTKHPYFDPAGMNNAGTMVGLYQPPGAARARVATLTRGGTITPVAAALEAEYVSVFARHIADDGSIIVMTVDVNGMASSFAIRGDSITPVTQGITPPEADICNQRTCFVNSTLLNYSDNGHVVGYVERVLVNDDGTREQVSQVAFFWDPQSGASPMTSGQAWLQAVSVNRHGAVLGYIRPDPQGPYDLFVWTRDKGTVLLRTLAPNLPPAGVEPESIGDGGHILLRDRSNLSVASALIVLTPLEECLEGP